MRPSKYKRAWNQKTIPLVEELMKNGGSIIEACQIMGISKATFYRWIHDPSKTAFRRKMDELVEASEAWWLLQGRQNLGNRSFNTSLYSINMQNRFKWNSAQSEQVRTVKETKTVKQSINVEGMIEKAENEAKKLREEGETPELKVVDSKGD